MNKFSFIALWDAYGKLLTPVQREITDLYFNLDLTVSEIAEQKGITRQAVSECLKGCKKQLEDYEEKLRFCKALNEVCLSVSFMETDACKWAEKLKIKYPDLKAEAEELIEILQKDYSAEVEKVFFDPETADLLFNTAAKEGLKVD